MKKRPELDVDFIGGGRKLTPEDTKAISEFIQANKLKAKEKAARKKKKTKSKKN